MSLPDPARSRAVIIGFPSYETLDDLPAVANNVRGLQEILTSPHSWNLPAKHCVVLPSLSEPEAPVSRDDVLDVLHTAAAAAEDALLVYFAGHGLLSESGELHLAVPRSDHRRLYRAVAYEDVRHELVTNCRARSRLVILDCCYSGSALTGYMGDEVVANRAQLEGAYIMASAAKTAPALAPPGETYTAFTGELLAALEDGVPYASALLRTDEVFQHVRRQLQNARPRRPVPQQRARNDGHAIVLARNRWTPPPPESRVPPVVRQQRRRPAHTRVPARVIGAAAAAVLLTAGLGSDRPAVGCDVRLTQVGDECIGISDGSMVFTSELGDVFRHIAAENRAAAEKPHATIALLTPMTALDDQGRRRILEQVYGAYIAQREANMSIGGSPPIRLALAQPGTTGGGWRQLAGQLTKMVDDPRNNLRAVVGFNAGDTNIDNAVRLLASRGVLTVGGNFTPERSSGPSGLPMVWTAPTAADQLKALAPFSSPQEKQLLIDDRRPGDLYVRGLRQAFLAKNPLPRELSYTSSSAGAPVPSSVFREMVAPICDSPAHVEEIFFAGRPTHLWQFLTAFKDRTCRDRNVTVVSGSDTAELSHDEELLRDLRGRGITVRYTAVADPDAWAKAEPQDREGAQEGDLIRRQAQQLGPHGLADGEAISVHDSVMTAITAIRAAVSTSQPVPGSRDVRNELDTLRGARTVHGASGWICLDNQGYAYDKAVAVLTLDGSGTGPHANGIAWPEGKPSRGCYPPA
ncbi:caspase family protein [Streptomyces sp. NPDC001034]|uniref:caspase family protein n=1 Tax=Streptomyces sp. NPDC001034 TaxID=3154375 RepID=UPI00331FE27A